MKSATGNPIEWFNDARSDYAAVKRSRMKRIQQGLPGAGSHADYHYRSEADYLRMVEIARDFDRNDPVVGQGFGRVVANVVQNGFTLDVVTSDPDLNEYLAAKWHDWADDRNKCDSQGELSFARMESLVFRSVIRDGDIFAIPLRNGTIRLYEGHRPRTPNGSQNTIHGIQIDENRRRVALKIAAEAVSPWATVTSRDVITIPWRDAAGNRQVFQVYNPDRISQTRGVSVTHAISDMVGMHDDIQFANLVRQQVVSCFAVMRERSPQFDSGSYGETATGPTAQDYTLGTQRILEQIAPGMIIDGAPGEKLVGFSPNVPNPQFFEHALMILTFIAVNLGVPLQVLLLDPSKTNFSGWRGAIDEARKSFRQMQSWLVEQFHQEVYWWKVRQWLATDETVQEAFLGGVDIFAHKWHPPTWAYIEPNKDAQADDLIISRGLSSRRRVLAARGMQYDAVIKEIAEETEYELDLCSAIAVKLNEKYKDQDFGKAWDAREIAARFMPATSLANLNGTVGEEEVADAPIAVDA